MSKNTQNGKAIVTYGRSLMSLMIARMLGDHDIEIIGCDSVAMTVLSFSKFTTKTEVYAPHDEDEEQFIADLLEIVKTHKPEDDRPYVLIPVFNDTKIIAKHKDKFKDLITVACPDYKAIDQVDPKDHFAKTVQKLGVNAPKTWMPASESDLQKQIPDMTFPVFIKPPDDVGGRGIEKIKTENDLIKAFKQLQKDYPGEQILIQTTAPGSDYCFCGLFDNGKRIAGMTYRNLRKFPHESGAGVVRETVEDEIFHPVVDQLMQPLKWNGVAEIDFMWDGSPENTPSMIEVNARFWAGLDHSVSSGVNFPWLLYSLFTDTSVDTPNEQKTAKIGHKTQLPGLSSLSRMHDLFASGIQLEELEAQWPEIKNAIKEKDLSKFSQKIMTALDDSISLNEMIKMFKALLKESKQAEKIAYAQDDPLVGLGILFILSSLVQHGKLPPEITH